MYKKIRIVICFTLIFCLAIMSLSPVSNAEFAITSAVAAGVVFSVLVASGVNFVCQNMTGQNFGSYFTGQVEKYVNSLGSTISNVFSGTVDYVDGDIQCDTEMQTNINNFLTWWSGDTGQTANVPISIINGVYIDGTVISDNYVQSHTFPGCFYDGSDRFFYGVMPDGTYYRGGNLAYGNTLTSMKWSIISYGNNSNRYQITYYYIDQYGKSLSGVYTLSKYFTYTLPPSSSTSSTLPDDFEGTIVTFIPPPQGTPTGNGNNSSGKNNIGLSAAVTGATIAGLVDAIDALYDKLATTTTPVEIPIFIIEEVPEPTPPPTPTPTPSLPFIPDGFEDIFNNLKNSLQNAQETIDDVKDAVDTVTQTTNETKDAIDEITEGINAEPDTSIDYKVSLTRVFPFCIPFDIYRLSNAFIAEPVTPSIDYTFTLPFLDFEYTLELDLSDFDGVASLLRSCEYIAFCIGLAIATSKVIKW